MSKMEQICKLKPRSIGKNSPIVNNDPVLNEISQSAAAFAGTPAGLVTFIDDRTSWIISRSGWEITHAPREAAFCAWAIHSAEVMWVEDALVDDRFRDNPFVLGEPHVRFYAGAPVTARENERIGTVCVLDTEPRRHNIELALHLETLAARAATHLQSMTQSTFHNGAPLGYSK